MMNDLDELVEQCDYNTKLAITAWVFRNIVEHAQQGGSFRYLIYDRLGFGLDAYVPLYEAGGMDISNEFDLTQKSQLIEIVQKHKIQELKAVLNFCDEPDCFSQACCGFPVENGYRRTCSDHSNFQND